MTDGIGKGAGMSGGRLKFWGWGYEGDGLDTGETEALLRTFADGLGILPSGDVATPKAEEIELAAPRLSPPD